MNLIEIQIDRLVGPTHHFGGLGVGNLASAQHAGNVSNPKAAAIQGLQKMKQVADLGVPQYVLPPQPRPDLELVRKLGFNDPQHAFQEAPHVFSAAMSCSAMWTANAATVTPAIDSTSNLSTASIANLSASLHRSIEPDQTEIDLREILPQSISVQSAIPGGAAMRDEGAANHMRLFFGETPGINLFVYGDESPLPMKHWPRQTRLACQAIARRHQLIGDNTFFLKQHPAAIDAGAFHNDVVAMSHANVWIHHQFAYHDDGMVQRVERRAREMPGNDLVRIEVAESELPIDQAVKCYLFNSQIVAPISSDGAPVVFCPIQVQQCSAAKSLVDQWIGGGFFSAVHYVDLDQSMAGGGGPACLRLRVPMPSDQVDEMRTTARLDDSKYHRLCKIISEGYPSEITLRELTDANLIKQACRVTKQLHAELLGN
ncbi:N-succinylarginine dihydrolase [Rubripirellula obstinata]|uniref:N-succinylarginine dihydrolase n=1 Tax=Rubripirellula obstinata TaxID=406547 RepID=A0A5B1CKZ0_9BACT|nr:N-succinylarginine dihydrolase [Rubripirellula obstinata]KAA1259994.1 N-succinylarginine dihydrolase [Rubripirellula obstinata]